jgi:hypothetical protein
LKGANPQVDLMAFDTFGLFNTISSQPANYGLTDISNRCVVDFVQVPACNPDQWFFWDATHPTTKGHSLIAQEMFRQVPGPLPLAGAAAAFSWSRRLRRRLCAASSRAQAAETGCGLLPRLGAVRTGGWLGASIKSAQV